MAEPANKVPLVFPPPLHHRWRRRRWQNWEACLFRRPVGATRVEFPGGVVVAASMASPWIFCSSGIIVVTAALAPESLRGREEMYRSSAEDDGGVFGAGFVAASVRICRGLPDWFGRRQRRIWDPWRSGALPGRRTTKGTARRRRWATSSAQGKRSRDEALWIQVWRLPVPLLRRRFDGGGGQRRVEASFSAKTPRDLSVIFVFPGFFVLLCRDTRPFWFVLVCAAWVCTLPV